MTLRKLCPLNTRGLVHVQTHRGCSSTHRAYTGVSHMDPSAEREDGHRSPPLIKKLFVIGTYLKKENCLCQWSLTRPIKHLQGMPHGWSRWPTQNKPSDVFVNFLPLTTFGLCCCFCSCHFFPLYSMVSNFKGFFVCVSCFPFLFLFYLLF